MTETATHDHDASFEALDHARAVGTKVLLVALAVAFALCFVLPAVAS